MNYTNTLLQSHKMCSINIYFIILEKIVNVTIFMDLSVIKTSSNVLQSIKNMHVSVEAEGRETWTDS